MYEDIQLPATVLDNKRTVFKSEDILLLSLINNVLCSCMTTSCYCPWLRFIVYCTKCFNGNWHNTVHRSLTICIYSLFKLSLIGVQPMPNTAWFRWLLAKVYGQVKSQIMRRPLDHDMIVRPLGRLPSSCDSEDGSSCAGMFADANVRFIRLLTAFCWIRRPTESLNYTAVHLLPTDTRLW